MATVGDAITAALQDLGVIAAGETPSDEDAQIGLDRLNDWIDSLGAERASIHAIERTTVALTSAASYTIASRPSDGDLVKVGYIDTSTTPDTEYPLAKLTVAQYLAIPQKALTGAAPTQWYYEPTAPSGTLYLLPLATRTDLTLIVDAWAPVDAFAALTDLIQLPRGYRRWFRLQLKIELADAFKVPIDGGMLQMARDAAAVVKRSNHRTTDLIVDAPGMGGWYDITADQVR